MSHDPRDREILTGLYEPWLATPEAQACIAAESQKTRAAAEQQSTRTLGPATAAEWLPMATGLMLANIFSDPLRVAIGIAGFLAGAHAFSRQTEKLSHAYTVAQTCTDNMQESVLKHVIDRDLESGNIKQTPEKLEQAAKYAGRLSLVRFYNILSHTKAPSRHPYTVTTRNIEDTVQCAAGLTLATAPDMPLIGRVLGAAVIGKVVLKRIFNHRAHAQMYPHKPKHKIFGMKI